MARQELSRTLRRAIALGVLAAGTFAAVLPTAAGATPAPGIFGGLGNVAEYGKGEESGKLHGPQGFVSDPKTGGYFIADEVTREGARYARVQAFNSSGAVIGESLVKLKTRRRWSEATTETVGSVGALAIDPERGRLYMLLNTKREERPPGVEQELVKVEREGSAAESRIEKIEAELPKAIEPKKAELEAELKAKKKELATLEATKEKDEGLFSLAPEEQAAAKLLAFSATSIAEGKLAEEKEVVEEKLLQPESETPGQAVIRPGGIAVSPLTHEVILLGQRYESAELPSGIELAEEDLRAEVQRVGIAESGGKVVKTTELGARYIDKQNCLDQGEGNGFCESDGRSEPSSPVVTAGGRLLVRTEGAIWEMPIAEGSAGAFAEFETIPAFAGDEATSIPVEGSGSSAVKLEPVNRELTTSNQAAVPNLMTYQAPISESGAGTLVLASAFAGGEVNATALVLFHLAEEGGKIVAQESGWTGGQSSLSKELKCKEVGGMVGGVLGAGSVLTMGTSASQTTIAAFGRGEGAEACGRAPEATQATIKTANPLNSARPLVGEEVTLASSINGARARGTRWQFKSTNPTSGEPETYEVAEQPAYELTDTPILSKYVFPHQGSYEITPIIQDDSLGHPETRPAAALKVEVAGLGAVLAASEEPFTAGQEGFIEGKVEDPAGAGETPLHLKALWKFGDGSAPVEVEYTLSSPSTERLCVPHDYSSLGSYEVTAKLIGKTVSGAPAPLKLSVEPSAGTTRTLSEPSGCAHAVITTSTTTSTTTTTSPTTSTSTTSTTSSTTSPTTSTTTSPTTSTTTTTSPTTSTSTTSTTSTTTSSTSSTSSTTSASTSSSTITSTSTTSSTTTTTSPPTTTTTTSTGPTSTTGGGGKPSSSTSSTSSVRSVTESLEPPRVSLAGHALLILPGGLVPISISCAAKAEECDGGAQLTYTEHPHGHHARQLVIATGSFSLGGGKSAAVSLHLTAAGRKLLHRLHRLTGQLLLSAHAHNGGSARTSATVTLRAGRGRRHGRLRRLWR